MVLGGMRSLMSDVALYGAAGSGTAGTCAALSENLAGVGAIGLALEPSLLA